MTTRAGAAIGLRIIAVWVLLQAAFYLVSLVFMLQHAQLPGPEHSTTAATVLAPNPAQIRDPYVSQLMFRSMLPTIAARFIAGFALLFAAKPLGRLLARRIE
jgi:hypothetical protein